jgi:hypothetical protein
LSKLTKHAGQDESRNADGQQIAVNHPSVLWTWSEIPETTQLLLSVVVVSHATRTDGIRSGTTTFHAAGC